MTDLEHPGDSAQTTTAGSAGPYSLAGRTAVVTGATSGIGAAVATALAGAGAHVLVTGRDAGRGDAVVEAIRVAGGKADFAAVDLAAEPTLLRAFAADARSLLGPVDILVNNAAVYPVGATADLPDADVDRMLAVNIRAPHALVAAFAPQMAARGHGVVVTVGSWMAVLGTPAAAMYSATKAAAEQLTRCWAAEYGPSGVRFNTVSPGVTLTPGNEAYRSVLDAMTATTPAGHVVRPEDIAQGVLFLAGDAAGMIHGATLAVDGGIAATRLS